MSYQDLEYPVFTISVVLGYISFWEKWRRDCGAWVYFEDQQRTILNIYWKFMMKNTGKSLENHDEK